MTSLFAEPSDVLLFRDGRSFSSDAGDRLARGVFPPAPTTFYGALRSALMSERGADFSAHDFGLPEQAAAVVGTKTESGSLSITRFALARKSGGEVQRLYPVPSDVLVRKEDADKEPEDRAYAPLRPEDDPPGRTNLPGGTDLLWIDGPSDSVFSSVDGYLPEPAFQQVLMGNYGEVGDNLLQPSDLFQKAPRTSVAIGSDGTGEEGMLFTVGFTRTAPEVGFALQVGGTGGLFPDEGWLRLGGESRSARYRTDVDFSQRDGAQDDLRQKVQESGRFKLALITPSPFENGWRPDGIGPDGTGHVAGFSVRLAGAAVNRPVPLGGWDMAKRRPKPTRRAAPTGSVYFFELDDPTDAGSLAGKGPVLSMASTDEDRKRGLGLAHLGTY